MVFDTIFIHSSESTYSIVILDVLKENFSFCIKLK